MRSEYTRKNGAQRCNGQPATRCVAILFSIVLIDSSSSSRSFQDDTVQQHGLFFLFPLFGEFFNCGGKFLTTMSRTPQSAPAATTPLLAETSQAADIAEDSLWHTKCRIWTNTLRILHCVNSHHGSSFDSYDTEDISNPRTIQQLLFYEDEKEKDAKTREDTVLE